MTVLTGRVRKGRVQTNPRLPEGTRVTVVVPDDEETFELTREEEAALVESLEQARRGKTVPAAEVLASIRRT